ncbi:MAG: hypothetical protein EXS50_00385 [Candidatus Taylorbacteria bacterium]|nr:hypothetical protein [Candidatus Taylorbacteria bacterium]
MKKISVHDLETKGYVSLPYPPRLKKAMIKTVKSWQAFCALRIDVKKALPYSNNADGVGYEFKEGEGRNADRKENFDITTSGKVWLEKNIERIKNKTALSFVKDATALVEIAKPFISQFASEVEKIFAMHGFAKEVKEGSGKYFFRFIHYAGDRNIGSETASAHVDQSGFTPHLFETEPGFEILDLTTKKWIPQSFTEGEMLIINSMQIQLRSQGKLKALCHRVVATPKTAKIGRYSAVCFVQFKDTAKYDKERCGRLQEKKPGFNYTMKFGDFQKLFKRD